MAVRTPSLRAISAFEAAARHQSFAKASAELNLTQSAISHAIRSLEQRLGRQLFSRSGRQVMLTEEGKLFAGHIRLSLFLLAEAFDINPSDRRSKLVVSLLPSFAEHVLVSRINEFMTANPGLEVELRCTPNLVDLTKQEVDVAVRYGPGGWAGLAARRLTGEYLFPVASPEFLRRFPLKAPEDIASCPLILQAEFPWRLWLEPLGLEQLPLERGLTTDNSSVALTAAKMGLGLALGRELLLAPHLAEGSLVRPFEMQVLAPYSYHCVWNPTSSREKQILAFTNWLERELGDKRDRVASATPAV